MFPLKMMVSAGRSVEQGDVTRFCKFTPYEGRSICFLPSLASRTLQGKSSEARELPAVKSAL